MCILGDIICLTTAYSTILVIVDYLELNQSLKGSVFRVKNVSNTKVELIPCQSRKI